MTCFMTRGGRDRRTCSAIRDLHRGLASSVRRPPSMRLHGGRYNLDVKLRPTWRSNVSVPSSDQRGDPTLTSQALTTWRSNVDVPSSDQRGQKWDVLRRISPTFILAILISDYRTSLGAPQWRGGNEVFLEGIGTLRPFS